MIQHINRILLQFRDCFKRTATWKNFIIVIMGFMLRTSNAGITSMVSSLSLRPESYYLIRHFFMSTAYETDDLYDKWIKTGPQEAPLTYISNRLIMLGDHIKVSKEARRMPDIQKMHQDSENSGKGEYIEGHMFAQISTVITKDGVSRSLPLISERQSPPPKKAGTKEPDGETVVTQMGQLSVKGIEAFDDITSAVIILDAYFSKASIFLAVAKSVDKHGNRRLTVITRAREDSVGYMPPMPRPKGKRGPSPKYGEKVVLRKLFSDMSDFTSTTMVLYGKKTKVRYKCIDLFWKPLGSMIRFVVVNTAGRGKMILMCDDLTMEPEDIITAYCLRFKIETSFDEQKNDIGSFDYHFWTSALPKRKRWQKNDNVSTQEVDNPEQVDRVRRAIDSFVCMATIATGITTIIAFSHNRQVWRWFPGWIKTLRSCIPSIAVTKASLAQHFHDCAKDLPDLEICDAINDKHRNTPFLYDDMD